MCLNYWKINFPIFIFRVMSHFIYNLRVTHRDFQVYQQPKKKVLQKWLNLQKRCAIPETNEKTIFRFLRFHIFWVNVDFVLKIHRKINQIWVKNDHISKNKKCTNRKIDFSIVSPYLFSIYFDWLPSLLIYFKFT